MSRGSAVPLGWLRSLWRRKLIVALGAAAGAAVAVAIVNVLPASFTSEGLILVDDRVPSAPAEPNNQAAGTSGSNRTQTEADIIGSRKIAEAVVVQLGLADSAALRSGLRWPAWLRPWVTELASAVDGLLGDDPDAASKMSREEKEAAAVEAVQRQLRVGVDPKSNVISVRFSAPSSGFAATVVNAVMDAYVAEDLAAREAMASQPDRRLNERLAALRAAFDDADRKVQAFRSENNLVDGPAAAAANAALDQLQRERDSRAQAYYAFLARVEQTRISSGQTATARIVSPAKPAIRPDGPTVSMIALLGALVGLLGTAIIVAGRQMLWGRIGSSRELSLASGVANIGTLPFSRQWAQPGMAVGILEARETGIADTLRGVRTALRNLSQPDDATVVLVTSAERGDGKSTTAASLASVCALDGLRVLLIEADLYRPRLAAILGWQLSRSLESVLDGADSFEDALCVDPQTGLHGLFAAGSADSPLAVLESPAFRDLMGRVRRDYDIVIMDSPPVLRVADPVVLAAHSDAILFAVGWGRISRAMLAEALERLPPSQPGELMTVMTRVPRHHLERQGYYRGYGRTVTSAGSTLRQVGRSQTVTTTRPVDEPQLAEVMSTGLAQPQPGQSAGRGDESNKRHRWAPSATAVVGAAAAMIAGVLMLIMPPVETADEAQSRAAAQAERQSDRVSTPRAKEQARIAAPAESTRKAEEEELARKAAAEKQAAEIAARRQTEEAERKAQEEAAARAAAEEKAAAEAEAEARRVVQEMALAEAAERKAAEEKAAAEAAAAARWREEEAARRAAEQKAKAEAREKAEAEARATAEENAKRQAADEARRQAEVEARRAADARPKSDAEARQGAEAAEAALRLSEQDRKRVQVALTSLGHDVRATSGTFGPRTRAMIAAWQRKQGLPETGYLTSAQLAALQQQAAPMLAKYDDAQGKPEAAPRKNEGDTQSPEITEAALRLSEQERKRVQVALNSLGHDIGGATGYFGPRTRAMITAWQKKQGMPETGYLTAVQLAALRRQAASALAKYDQAQRRAAEDTPRTE